MITKKRELEKALRIAVRRVKALTHCGVERCPAMPHNGREFPCKEDGCTNILMAYFLSKAKFSVKLGKKS